MKVVLLGKNGMLGSAFLQALSGDADFEIFAFSREDLDISDYNGLRKIFSRISPDFVINCAAYTAVDDCEKNTDLANKVNGESLGIISKACKAENCILIHFSTDYVFNGEKHDGYLEGDEVDPVNAYGVSKLLGEENIREFLKEHFIIRTAWLFGDNGKNFVDTMIRLGKDRDELSIVDDQVGSPTYTKDLCNYVIDNFLRPFFNIKDGCHKRSGLTDLDFKRPCPAFGVYHATNSGYTSWFAFAQMIFKEAGIEINLEPISSAEFAAPAKRPSFSILKNTKIKDDMRPWEDALKAYLRIAL